MFLEYQIESKALIMGERIKGGTFRPSYSTIPYSQISGALKSLLGYPDIHATGVIDNYRIDYFTYSPLEKVTKINKQSLITEVLTQVIGRVYVINNEYVSANLPRNFELFLGGLRSKGFGACELEFKKEVSNPKIRRGILATRIPCSCLDLFMIKSDSIIKPIFGYVFKPITDASGIYVKSIFEGSEVIGPEFLLKGTTLNNATHFTDNIEKILNDIQFNKKVNGTRFTNRFLSAVSAIYEKRGYGAAWTFLENKSKLHAKKSEAEALLVILEMVKKAELPPAIGGYIIKKIPLILKLGEATNDAEN